MRVDKGAGCTLYIGGRLGGEGGGRREGGREAGEVGAAADPRAVRRVQEGRNTARRRSSDAKSYENRAGQAAH